MLMSIKREQVPTDTGKKLYDLLVKSWNNDNFIYNILSTLRGDEMKQKLVGFIESGNTDSDDITLEVMAIKGLITRK